ncbi:hypothetical protein K523DRAFT_341206 [Schizophyllum commune Tattone D]|nr:hypothetical protein K523DRAFT_341206 [Schizophyllum commune Tattone D]
MAESRRTPPRIKASSSFSVTTRARSYVSTPSPTSVLNGRNHTEIGSEANNPRLPEASSEVVPEERSSAAAPDSHANLPPAGSFNESNDASTMSKQNIDEEAQSCKDALRDILAEVEALKAELHSMMESKDLVMSCSVCFTADSSPRVLGCGHTFCESCLTDIYYAKPIKSYLACPTCSMRISTSRTPILCYQLRDAWALSNGVSRPQQEVQLE